MNADVKRQWVEALRSGKYTKGRGSLRLVDKYCCLGVLCDVSGTGEWDDLGNYVVGGVLHKTSLPRDLAESTGVTFAAHKHLVKMNDIEGTSFAAIANWVEENL